MLFNGDGSTPSLFQTKKLNIESLLGGGYPSSKRDTHIVG